MIETLLKLIGYSTNAYVFIVTNIKAIVIALATITVLYFVIGFFNLRNELAATKRDLAEAQAHVAQLKRDVEDISSARDDLSKKSQELEKQRRELAEKLIKHDLSKIARRHPRMVEKAVNNGTEKVFKCFESVTRGGGC
jgi:hypothetical protein